MMKRKISHVLALLLLGLISKATTVSAHEEPLIRRLDTASSINGPLYTIFIASGVFIFVLIILSAIWLIRRDLQEIDNPETYGEKINSFGLNARLYILHIQGMSLTYGVRSIIYNIYLLYVFAEGVHLFGWDLNPILFIGILMAMGSIISGLMSPFNGIVVDKLGKKWSFIMGDFFGAMMILTVVLFPITTVVIFAQIFRSAVMSIHGIAEGPFIYEQSTSKERVHLFSVSSGMSTLASMSGNLIAGVVPLGIALLLFGSTTVFGQDSVFVLQIALIVSVLLWLISLIPALYLREDPEVKARSNQHSVSARMSFKNVTHWRTIMVFVFSAALIGLGAGMFVQFFQIFFLEVFSASPSEIAIIFAVGSLFIAIGNFVSPILAERFGKVNMIVITRLIGTAFIFLLPYSPSLFIAGVYYLFRSMFFNSTQPTESALAMETVNDAERTSMEAFRMAASSIFSAIGYLVGGYFMGIADFTTPFLLAGTAYFLASLIFWLYFRDESSLTLPQEQPVEQPTLVAD